MKININSVMHNLRIKFMTDEEVMRYLIKSNEKN